MQEQTTGYIALRPTGNSQGSYLLMSLTTGRILNRRGFTLLPLQQDVINGMHHLTHRNPRGLDIRDRDRHPFLEPEYGSNDEDNDSTYAPSDNDNSNNEDESGNNDSDKYDKSNLHPPSDQEMVQGPAGVKIHKNAGVHQNANMHLPQNRHNDPHNDPIIKTENTIGVIGNENKAEYEDKNEAENEDKNEHVDWRALDVGTKEQN